MDDHKYSSTELRLDIEYTRSRVQDEISFNDSDHVAMICYVFEDDELAFTWDLCPYGFIKRLIGKHDGPDDDLGYFPDSDLPDGSPSPADPEFNSAETVMNLDKRIVRLEAQQHRIHATHCAAWVPARTRIASRSFWSCSIKSAD